MTRRFNVEKVNEPNKLKSQMETISRDKIYTVREFHDFLKFCDRSLDQDSKKDVFVEINQKQRSISLIHTGEISNAQEVDNGVRISFECQTNTKLKTLEAVCEKSFSITQKIGLEALECISRFITVQTETINAINKSKTYLPKFMIQGSEQKLICALENISLNACLAASNYIQNNIYKQANDTIIPSKSLMSFETFKAKIYEVLSSDENTTHTEMNAKIHFPVSVFLGGPILVIELNLKIKSVNQDLISVKIEYPSGIDYEEKAFQKIIEVLSLRPNIILLNNSN